MNKSIADLDAINMCLGDTAKGCHKQLRYHDDGGEAAESNDFGIWPGANRLKRNGQCVSCTRKLRLAATMGLAERIS